MSVLFFAGVVVTYHYEQAGNPNLTKLGIATAATDTQSGGNMEGKEVRFGIANSALFTTVTTDASCGAVNNAHDSLTPLAGLVPLINIELGEVVFGGVGSGLYGVLMFAVLAVFIAGLMVGRTPEYLGKKIEQKEVKMMMLAVLVLAFTILGFAGAGANLGTVGGSLGNHGPHGFSEVLYAYTSATGNNGSAFGGINANTPYLDTTLGLAMLSGRFLMLIPLLAAAGSLAQKKLVPVSAGTFPTHGPLFVALLVGVIVIVGALTFFPALSLGPVVEHFLMHAGRLWS
jgi:K+-transporting ATPase ATPase A chain